MTVRLYLTGERVGLQLRRSGAKNVARIRTAERGAARDTVNYIVPKVRADIKGAGKFGTRWTEGFQGKITEGGGFIRIAFTEKVPYWRIFQTGGIIHGRPLLWIPLSFANDAKGVNARDYPGKLFRVNRNGKAPLLLAVGRPAQPKYFGKPFVKIPKKFHIVEIVREGSKKMKDFYRERMKNG